MKVVLVFMLLTSLSYSQLNERWILVEENETVAPFEEANFYLDQSYTIPMLMDSFVVSLYHIKGNKLFIPYYTGDDSIFLRGMGRRPYVKFRRRENYVEVYRRRKRIRYNVYQLPKDD